jgi:hypothetical protein
MGMGIGLHKSCDCMPICALQNCHDALTIEVVKIGLGPISGCISK